MAGRQTTSKAGGTERQLSWSLSMASSCSLKAGRGPLEAETVWEEKMSLEVYRLLRVEPHDAWRFNSIIKWPPFQTKHDFKTHRLSHNVVTTWGVCSKREKGLVIGPPPHDGFSKRETEAIMERWPLRPSFSCIKQERGAPFLRR